MLPVAICAVAADGALTASASISAVSQRVICELLLKGNNVRRRTLSDADERPASNSETNKFANKLSPSVIQPGCCNNRTTGFERCEISGNSGAIHLTRIGHVSDPFRRMQELP